MSNERQFKFDTLALHAGQVLDSTTSRGVPVYRTSSYVFKSTEHAANLFALKELGNIYTRLTNPTHDVLEQRITALEGGAASVAFASGTNAIFSAIITIAQNGDEIVSANNLYGGTYTMFDAILPTFGIKTNFVKPDDWQALKRQLMKRQNWFTSKQSATRFLILRILARSQRLLINTLYRLLSTQHLQPRIC